MTKRTMEQLKKHFEIERELTKKLLESSRDKRKELYKTTYNELFQKVPDHPSLTKNPEKIERANVNKYKLVKKYVGKNKTFAEFGPGDCEFCYFLSNMFKKVYGLDILDQSETEKGKPNNFVLIEYDGYNIDLPNKSIDILFSHHVIEHIHPDDISLHFKLAKRILKDRAVYKFVIPHRYRGPSDISKYFSDIPQGLHLNEPIYTEIISILKEFGFTKIYCYWLFGPIIFRLPKYFFMKIEYLFRNIKQKYRRPILRYLIPQIVISAKN